MCVMGFVVVRQGAAWDFLEKMKAMWLDLHGTSPEAAGAPSALPRVLKAGNGVLAFFKPAGWADALYVCSSNRFFRLAHPTGFDRPQLAG